MRDLCCSQNSSSASASLFLELPEHNNQRLSSLCSMYTHHPEPKAEPKQELVTSMILQSGPKQDPVLTFILFIYLSLQLVQCSPSSSLIGDLHSPSSLLKQRAPTFPPHRAPSMARKIHGEGLLTARVHKQQQMMLPGHAARPGFRAALFTHSHSSHNCFPANTLCWLSILQS